ncbi:MAG: helix-turn-helix domain-containing protein [Acidibrevibacterium sp.]|uniref:helix-turn-helix domain-containing protein n=1 Tax=Acidibrevibacterium fodinaquatile TaxID=1969806 RepID=UPI0023A80421|nr:helix-turn-helix domain-containing protein [Acidibrevibacterium fodinaquatile]MCA7121262.1 helix-turn-helix domain-containing protein [Acidibrevibacterium fodinaquatile]
MARQPVMRDQGQRRMPRPLPRRAWCSRTAKEIRALREREGASQAVFARYLNVTTGLISQWERGEKHPKGASLKLLSLVAKHGLETVA